jgi:hypothetical protein
METRKPTDTRAPTHDPENEKPGANDDGYGAHRNNGDMTGTQDGNSEE